MMKKTNLLLFVLLGLYIISGCKTDKSNNSDTINKRPSASIINADSAKVLFEKYSAENWNEFPSKAIYEVGKVYPVDEAPLDTSFFVFRGQLMDAVRNKNIFKLLPMIDNNIKADFGSAEGKDSFVEVWELKDQAKVPNSNLWPILENILLNGGSFSNKGSFFIAPYTFSNFPESGDMFEQVVIAGAGVRIRAEPNLRGAITAKLSHDLVKYQETTSIEETIAGETYPWIQIQLEDEKIGYVWGKFVVAPLSFRAGFEKKSNGKWKMVFLVAGD